MNFLMYILLNLSERVGSYRAIELWYSELQKAPRVVFGSNAGFLSSRTLRGIDFTAHLDLISAV